LCLADFLAGDVSTSSIAVGIRNASSELTHSTCLPGFDSGHSQAEPDFGLRYEYFGPLYSDKKDLAVFIPGKGMLIQGNGIDSIFPPDRNNSRPALDSHTNRRPTATWWCAAESAYSSIRST